LLVEDKATDMYSNPHFGLWNQMPNTETNHSPIDIFKQISVYASKVD